MQFETDSTERPLDERTLKRLKANWKTLLELITLEGGLVAELYAKKCITNLQRLSIEGAGDVVKMNTRLLHIMLRKSVSNFNCFIECLIETQQRHVAYILLKENAGKL